MHEIENFPPGFVQIGTRYFGLKKDEEEEPFKFWRIRYVCGLTKDLMDRFFKTLKEEDIQRINETLRCDFQTYKKENIFYGGDLVRKIAGDYNLARDKMQAFTVAINELHRGIPFTEVKIRLGVYLQYIRFRHHTLMASGSRDKVLWKVPATGKLEEMFGINPEPLYVFSDKGALVEAMKTMYPNNPYFLLWSIKQNEVQISSDLKADDDKNIPMDMIQN